MPMAATAGPSTAASDGAPSSVGPSHPAPTGFALCSISPPALLLSHPSLPDPHLAAYVGWEGRCERRDDSDGDVLEDDLEEDQEGQGHAEVASTLSLTHSINPNPHPNLQREEDQEESMRHLLLRTLQCHPNPNPNAA